MNLAPLFQSISQSGGQYADARLQAPMYRLKLLLDKLKAQQGEVDLADMQERLRRLKLQPDTEEGALTEKMNALKKAAENLGIKLDPQDYRTALGLQPRISSPFALWQREHPEGTFEEYEAEVNKYAEEKKGPKAVTITPVPGSSEPYKITDAQGKTWDVNDPNLPMDLRKELATYKEAQAKGEEKKALIEARKNAEAINRAIAIGDARELQKQRGEVFRLARRGLSGHSFLKTVAQEVAAAELTGGRGTTSGDMMIVEGFMQLMFGVDPKALRGSPKMMEVLLKQGGWDDKAIAMMNNALTGGKLSQEVRNQILEGAQRQVTSWDQTVTQSGQLVEDPQTKALIDRYLKTITEGMDLTSIGGKRVE